MIKGDIVLITFPFTDLTGPKLRPGVVLSEIGPDITVCFITTQIQHQDPTDILISPEPANGIKAVSVIRTSKIATLDKSLIKGLLGKLSSSEISQLNHNLKILFSLLS